MATPTRRPARKAAKKAAKRAAAPKTTIKSLATPAPISEKTAAASTRPAKAKRAKAVKTAKDASPMPAPAKPANPAPIRDKFTMPQADYDRIAKLKSTAKRVGLKVKKNELLRLGLKALQGWTEDELRAAVLALRAPA